MVDLARVLDKEALASATGKAGRTSLRVPAAWLAHGDTIELVVPAMLQCARCDGGGCDACERSGGLRLDGDAATRRVRLVLPKRTDESAFVVRLVQPLGDVVALDQLEVQIAVGELATAGCTRIETAAPATRNNAPAGAPALHRLVLVGFVVLAIAAAIIEALRQ